MNNLIFKIGKYVPETEFQIWKIILRLSGKRSNIRAKPKVKGKFCFFFFFAFYLFIL